MEDQQRAANFDAPSRYVDSHLSSKVIRQSPIRVKHGKIRSADIAHTQLLVPRRSRIFGELLQFALLALLLCLERFCLCELCHGLVNLTRFTCCKGERQRATRE